MTRIAELIGYDVEVSVPNGPAVHGYITARWADLRQLDFERALDRIKADAWDEGVRAARNAQPMTTPHPDMNPYRKEQN